MPQFGTGRIPDFHSTASPRLIAAEESAPVETFLLIVLPWLTPGILLFIYLLWISKRVRRSPHDLDARIGQPGSPLPDDTDSPGRK
jgi:hypothetical protein